MRMPSANADQCMHRPCRPGPSSPSLFDSAVFESNLVSYFRQACPRLHCEQRIPAIPASQDGYLNHRQWRRLLSEVLVDANLDYDEWQNAWELLCRCLIHSDTLGNALKLMERFPRNHCIPYLKFCSDGVESVISIEAVDQSTSFNLLQIASCIKLFSWLIDEPIAALRAYLAQSESIRVRMPIESLFQCSVCTGSDQWAIAIDRSLLTRPVARDYRDLRTILALPSLAHIPWPSAKSLRTQVLQLIGKGVARYGHAPTLPEIALLLGRGASSIRRQLFHEGTSFQAIKTEWREQRAKELLRSTASLDEIANQLGFECTSVFSRAFKSWTGLAPSIYRHTHR